MKYSSRISTLLSIPLFAGCATTSSAPSLPLPPGTETTTPEIKQNSGVASWKVSPTEQSQTYSSILTTVITQADVLPIRRDSLVTRALYSIKTIRSSDTVSFSGSIVSFSVQRNPQDSAQAVVTTPISFSGKITNHSIISRLFSPVSTQEQFDCENIAQTSLKTIQRSLIVLPVEIRAGQTWTDSTSFPACSGELPTMTVVLRTFTVVGESQREGISALILNENERTFSTGEGSQGQHRVSLKTEGSANGQIYVDRHSGQLLAINTRNTTSVAIETSGRVQHFTQNSIEVTQIQR